ncbi:MAG TPA: hypothetical protein VN948_18085 [Terriglobales bacterium]|nr:hypothetical protein [Terriglobales bacterium]
MTRKSFPLTLLLLCVSANIAARAATSDEIIPAGTILQCTLDEPNFSAKTAQVGDPVLCYLSHVAAFGHSVFPRGAELSGHLQDYQNPGHFVGKGWIEMDFDRIILPGAQVIPLSAKVVSAPHLKVDAEGKVHGRGHPKRDAVLWAIPVFWPVKIFTLPARGPFPAFKGEARLTLRLMEDIEVGLPVRSSVPMPPWAAPSRYDASSYRVYRPASTAPREQTATLQPANFVQPPAELQRTEQPSTVIVLKGGAAWLAHDYWVEAGQLHCVSQSGEQKLVALETMDLYETVRVNRERHVEFVLRSKGPVEQ